jgi:heme/copper-type cytochrome/quinol oxidase subunit 2
MNPSRFNYQNMQSGEARQEKDSRHFWIVTMAVVVLIAIVALAFFLRP